MAKSLGDAVPSTASLRLRRASIFYCPKRKTDFACSACFAVPFSPPGPDAARSASMTDMESAVPASKEHGTAKHAEHANRCLSGQASAFNSNFADLLTPLYQTPLTPPHPDRHGRPSMSLLLPRKSWMAGTRPAMTEEVRFKRCRISRPMMRGLSNK